MAEPTAGIDAWVAVATADLAAVRLLSSPPDASPELLGFCCFHAQQAAEKALKAVMVACDVPFPFIHDLVRLAEMLQPTEPVPEEDAMAMVALGGYASGPRYPRRGAASTRGQVMQADRDARVVVGWAVATLVRLGHLPTTVRVPQ